MKRIPLTQGKFAIVDDEDYDRLIRYKWYTENPYPGIFYARASNKNKVFMHHMVLGGRPKQLGVDHCNRNGLDNRKCNLRWATTSQNQWNRKIEMGTSKYKGVCRMTGTDKWLVRIGYKIKIIH